MARDSYVADLTDIAGTIARLPAEDLAGFIEANIRKRSLHRVVANLNEAALSKTSQSGVARSALRRLGFAD